MRCALAIRALLASSLAISIASCDRKGTAAAKKVPIAIPRADGQLRTPDRTPDPAATASCAKAVAALAPDTGVADRRAVVVLFWAKWSAPDKLLMPLVESEVARDRDRWRLVKSDIDEEPNLALACNIRSIPTLVAFAGGKPVSQVVGAVPRERVRRFLDAIPANDRSP